MDKIYYNGYIWHYSVGDKLSRAVNYYVEGNFKIDVQEYFFIGKIKAVSFPQLQFYISNYARNKLGVKGFIKLDFRTCYTINSTSVHYNTDNGFRIWTVEEYERIKSEKHTATYYKDIKKEDCVFEE